MILGTNSRSVRRQKRRPPAVQSTIHRRKHYLTTHDSGYMPRAPSESGGSLQPEFGFDHQPLTGQSFENALAKARNGNRLTVDDGVELLTTGTDEPGIDQERKELVLELADRRRAEIVGDEVSFVQLPLWTSL